jgi:SAM-dependent methyltransferase
MFHARPTKNKKLMSITFKDHFSGNSAGYRAYRPGYPISLFAFLAASAPSTRQVWDCATGNGQAAEGLAQFFSNVIATDASPQQIENAVTQPNITYRVARAEHSGIESDSIDLVTVAQAIHWFDLPEFYSEVKRVLRDQGVLAIWSYKLFSINAKIDSIMHDLYYNVLGDYWPCERKLIDEGYANLSFPFDELSAPLFQMSACWNLSQTLGYLGTWSALARFRSDRQQDPLDELSEHLAAVWGDPDICLPIRWPMSIRVGRLSC